MENVPIITGGNAGSDNRQLLELLRWLVGSGLLVGTVFWASATYTRVGVIEEHLGRIDTALSSLSDLSALKARQEVTEKELERLRLRVEGRR